jgi:KDO2-lipid IV(A) lauroyltransferase
MVAGIGRTEYRVLKGLRQRVDQAILHGSHHFGTTWNIEEVGRELAGNQIRWRTRDQLLDGLSQERVAPLFSVEGREGFDAALQRGHGVVLLCNHFGSHMMPAHWLMREGYPLRLFMERPRHISKFLSQRFDTDGPTGQKRLFISRKASPAEAASSIMRASRVLRDGMILMIAGDVRWAGALTSEAEFLGRRYSFSNTWVKLAAMSGAPVVPDFCRIDDQGGYQLSFLDQFTVPSDGADPESVGDWVQGCLRTIESQVARHPANSNEYFFWAETHASNAAASTSRR